MDLRNLTPTADPLVFIEDSRPGYVRYRLVSTGRRWEVWGTCDRRGDCLIGTLIRNEHGEYEQVRDHAHIEELKGRLGRERIDSEMDVPTSPESDSCCSVDRFTFVELEPLSGD